MAGLDKLSRCSRFRMVVIGTVLFCSYAYFYEGGGWNQNTRFDLARAVVVHRTLSIDDYADNTGDKSRFGGHTYIDKAPGASFTAVPAVALLRSALRASGHRVDSVDAIAVMSYGATIMASAAPAMLAALAVFWISRRVLGASDTAAAVTTLAFGLGSPLWAYAIVFFGHALSAGCLMMALAAACALGDAQGRRRDIVLGALVGIGGGWATVSEYPCLIPAVMITMLAAYVVCGSARSRCIRVGSAIATPAAACAVMLLIYNAKAFGHPLSISYQHFDDPVVMHSGFFDIISPNARVLPELLFGQYRGLLPLCPVLFLAPFGWAVMCRDARTRALGLLISAAVTFAILLNVSYLKWTGGWNYGPRHMVWSLGFAFLGLVPLWTHAGRLLRGMILTLVAVGSASSFLAVTTTVQPPNLFARPLIELWWPAFSSGMMALNRQTYLDLRPVGGPSGLLHDGGFRAAWNLGQRAGLGGHLSLLPLLAVWMACAALWWVAGRTEVN